MSRSNQQKFESIFQDLADGGETSFSYEEARRLSLYYAIVLKWNIRIPLTTITDPREFFTRHILESAFVAKHLKDSITQVWDIGTGLGVPGIPLAILKPYIKFHLVESGKDKSIFLEEAVFHLGLDNVRVARARLETLEPLPEDSCLTARAVEKMESMAPRMLKIGAKCEQILLLGNDLLAESVKNSLSTARSINIYKIPDSERRLLIEIVPRETY